jgi:hypothetical protein
MSKIIIPRFKKIIFELPLLKNKDSLFTSGTLAWLKDHRYCKGAFEAGIKLNLFTETQIKYIKDFLHHLKKAD